jgi:hypothetical protein
VRVASPPASALIRISPGCADGALSLRGEVQIPEARIMSSTVGDPKIGQWYERSDNGVIFQVTGLDDNAKTIELQAVDGNLDEVDPETWAAMPLEPRGSLEDWLGPIDDMEADDFACSDAQMLLDDPTMLERLC